MKLEEHPTVKRYREGKGGEPTDQRPAVLDAAWVKKLALEAGADDVLFTEESAEVYTAPSDLQTVRQAFLDAHVPIDSADLSMIAKTYASLSPADTLQVMNLIESLEELDDIAKVYSNLDISEEALAAIEV